MHRHEAFEQLLIAIEKFSVNLNVVSFYYALKLTAIGNISLTKVHLTQQLLLLVCFFASSINQGQPKQYVHVAGALVPLHPLRQVIAEQRNSFTNFIARTLMNIIN